MAHNIQLSWYKSLDIVSEVLYDIMIVFIRIIIRIDGTSNTATSHQATFLEKKIKRIMAPIIGTIKNIQDIILFTF